MADNPWPLPADTARLLTDLARALGADHLRLFGGAALDLLTDPASACHDLDIALPRRGITADQCLADLAARPEIEVLGHPRPYWIRFSVPVLMVSARWRHHLLDLNFLDDVHGIGHFDIEQVYWDYPSQTITDPHRASTRPVTAFHLVTSVDDDNPILLLNRIAKLSAKYDVPFWLSRHLRAVVGELVRRARAWASPDHFHGAEAHEAHLRAVASSVRRVEQPLAFLAGCLESGFLDARLHPLATVLRKDCAAIARLTQATRDDLFWRAADWLVNNGGTTWRAYRPGIKPVTQFPAPGRKEQQCDTAW